MKATQRRAIAALSLLAVVSLAGCEATGHARRTHPEFRVATGDPVSPAEARARSAENAARARATYASMSFEEFRETVWCEPEELGGKYIVNGDRPVLNEKQLREFFEQEVCQEPTGPGGVERMTQALTVNRAGGLDDLWNGEMQRRLTYCVSTDFGSRYQDVVLAMEQAADAWEAAADIDFIHDSSQDGSCTATNEGIVFDIRPVDVNGNYLARAFFPNDPRDARNVLIDRSAFDVTGNLTLVGILRHELGHTLGFRHEHTRPESGACFEDEDWRPVTDYDPFSVMHYPQCNGAGDWSLTLTDLDRNGAACVYGPAEGFTLDPSLGLAGCRTPSSEPCGPRTRVEQGSVAQGAEQAFGPFPVHPGSTFEVVMTGTGDPDLYTRFEGPATASLYDCRPYLNGADETCSLTVPRTASEAFVMVRGYRAGSFTLTITHQGPTP